MTSPITWAPLRPRAAATALTGALALLLSLVVTVLLPAAPASAATEEVYYPPSSGSWQIEGHGFGHGTGLSQYGAQGGAKLGKTAAQIIKAYYPGTTTTCRTPTGTEPCTLPKSKRTIRVHLCSHAFSTQPRQCYDDTNADVVVAKAAGLTITDTASGASKQVPTAPTKWRAKLVSGVFKVQYFDGSWHAYSGLSGSYKGPIRFSSDASHLRVWFDDGTARDYWGTIRAVKTSTGNDADGVAAVATMSMDHYLYGVVPREMPADWQPEALKAQAMAARSYSAYVSGGTSWDICDSTRCQVFGGTALVRKDSSGTYYTKQLEGDGTPCQVTSTTVYDYDATCAVKETSNQVPLYSDSANGQLVFAQFSSSNGGYSAADGRPHFEYLAANPDPWDDYSGNPVHYWTTTLSASRVASTYGLSEVTRLRITSRDGHGEWGGRVTGLYVDGVSKSTGDAVTVSASSEGGFGLRSRWWRVKPSKASDVVTDCPSSLSLVKSPGKSTKTVTVSLKNTGSSAWSTGSLHLAWAPDGAQDPLVGGSTTPGTYAGSADSVAPGATASFTLAFDAAGVSPGTYHRSYRLQSGTGSLYGDPVTCSIAVAAAQFRAVVGGALTSPDGDNAPGVDQAPPVVTPGGRVILPRSGTTKVRVPVTNTGNLSWPVGAAVVLATSGDRDRTSPSAGDDWVSSSRAARLTGDLGDSSATTVRPGRTGYFDITLHGNGKPVGVTKERFEPLWVGKHWIEGAVATLTVVRTDPAVPHSAVAYSAPQALSLRAYPLGTATLQIKLRNTGSSRWKVGGAVSLGTASPRDRSDVLRTTAWAGKSRVLPVAGNRSRAGAAYVWPGEVGLLTVPISAFKHKAGSYTEAFQAVVGDTWFGPVLGPTVTVKTATMAGRVVAQSGTLSVPRAGKATAWIDVKNTGDVAWPVGSTSGVRVTVIGGADSPSASSGWLNARRPTALDANRTRAGATTVKPGEVGRFSFSVNGNGREPATVSEAFGVGWEGWASTAVKAVITYRIT